MNIKTNAFLYLYPMTSFKQILLLVGVSFVTLSVSNCGAAKSGSFEANPPFKIGSAYVQDWIAGVQGGGSGTNFYISFSNIEESVVFENVYYGKKGTALVSSPNVRVQYIGYFKNTTNSNIIMDGETINEAANTPPLVSTYNLAEDEAVLSYTQNGKLKHYKISGVERKEPLAYPGVNPNGID